MSDAEIYDILVNSDNPTEIARATRALDQKLADTVSLSTPYWG